MSKPYKKIVASVGKYTDKEGNEKKRWQNVGTLFQGDDGNFSIKLDAVPVSPEWSGWFSCFDLDSKKKDESGDAAPPF